MAKKIVLYGSDNCGFCAREKAWLTESHVDFEFKNVDADRDAFREFRELQESLPPEDRGGIPVLKVDDVFIVGFDVPKIKEALKK